MTADSTLADNLDRVRRRIASAARSAGRDPSAVELLAVTKTVSPETAAALCELGQRDLGENRADALERKCAHFQGRALAARWHFIGHVQRNKLRRIVALADVVHSVDSIELLLAIDRAAERERKVVDVYLQLKLTREPTKTGLEPERAARFVESARGLSHARLVGLMAMAPLAAGDEAPLERERPNVFEVCAQLARELESDVAVRPAFAGGRARLSMGMSDDFESAIAAGSDCVRVGTLLFVGLSDARTAAPREAQ